MSDMASRREVVYFAAKTDAAHVAFEEAYTAFQEANRISQEATVARFVTFYGIVSTHDDAYEQACAAEKEAETKLLLAREKLDLAEKDYWEARAVEREIRSRPWR